MATAKQRAARRPSRKSTRKPKDKAASAGSTPQTSATAVSAQDRASKKNVPAAGRRRLPSAWAIGQKAVTLMWSHRYLFLGILAIYAVLSIVLGAGFTNDVSLSDLKEIVKGTNPGALGSLLTGMSLYSALIASVGAATTGTAAMTQFTIGFIVSLAVIWSLRQVMAGEKRPRVRDSFYKGMYPLIPVFLILLVIVAQLLPFMIGSYLFGMTITGGIAVTAIEKLLWSLVLVGGVSISVYWLTSSIIALYIATLPDMTPLAALRSARNLVKGRRWPLIRKLLALPVALMVGSTVIMLPFVLFLTVIAPWAFIVIALLNLLLMHAYLYTLYRELLA